MSTAIIILTLDEIDGVRAIVPKLNNDWAEEIILLMGVLKMELLKKQKSWVLKLFIKIIRGKATPVE